MVMTANKLFLGILVAASALAFPACEDESGDNNEESLIRKASASLNGAQESPAVNTGATGSFQGNYNTETGEFSFTLNWSGLSGPPTMMHFHGPAAPGENASIKIGIDGFPESASGSVGGEVTVEAADRSDLLGGKWYVNIHTADHGGGEIRGQVTFSGSGGNNGGDGGGYDY